MALVQWNEIYRVGIPDIDRQHEQLFETVNLLHDSLREDRPSAAIDEIFDRLIDYATTHFATEEHYFRLFDYAGADDHIRQHRQFAQDVVAFHERLTDKADRELPYDLMRFLSRWLVVHVSGADQDYATHFARRGVLRELSASPEIPSRITLPPAAEASTAGS